MSDLPLLMLLLLLPPKADVCASLGTKVNH